MELMQFLFKAFIIIFVAEVASEWLPTEFFSRTLPMVWIDGRYRANVPAEIDTFFDRVISISYFDRSVANNTRRHQGIGVFITTQLLLTSFNAFRTISLSADTMNHMEVMWNTYRFVNETGHTVEYDFGRKKIKCARHVIPSPEYDTWPKHMQHGPHSPLHDLMILRLEINVDFVNLTFPVRYEFSDYQTWEPVIMRDARFKTISGPLQTVIAKPADMLSRNELRFVSIGHLNDEHIKENRYLELGEFGAIVDCDEWIPRQWGNFICLENTEKYPGLANGALLFCNVKLIGVGSFMLRKAKTSILVFTDVRPYWHLLHRTCTVADQELRVPDDLKPNT